IWILLKINHGGNLVLIFLIILTMALMKILGKLTVKNKRGYEWDWKLYLLLQPQTRLRYSKGELEIQRKKQHFHLQKLSLLLRHHCSRLVCHQAVLSDRSATEVDNNFSKPPPFFPPGAPPTHLPPPPFLPPPPTVSTAPPLIPPPGIPITVPPPGFPPPPGAPPPSLIPTIESGHSSGYDSRSARAFPYG
ncbi:FIP1 like 1 (S. cerevisiae), isoform CRA_b, partial [Mus musculus]